MGNEGSKVDRLRRVSGVYCYYILDHFGLECEKL